MSRSEHPCTSVGPSAGSVRYGPYQDEGRKKVPVHEDSDDSEVENEAKDNFPPQKKPVWVDEEDEDEEMVDMRNNRFRKDMMKNASESKLSKKKLQKRLKEEFQHAMGGVPAWAERSKRKTSSDDESEEDEDDLLQRTGNFLSTSASLPRGILKMKNCQHANAERPTTAQISSVQFHPCAQVVMVAGLDNAFSLFQVDGKTNPKIQSIYLEKFPIFKACFSANGEQVLATSTHSKVLYVYDMLAGKLIPVHQVRGLKERIVRSFEVSPDGSFLLINGIAGYSHLLSMKTKELIGSMKINGRVSASAFTSDSKKIYTYSGDGEVYVWDMNSRKCLNRFVDEGSLRGLSIAASRNGQYVACGSGCGVVNIYNQDSCLQETNPKPIKAIMNLVTGVTSLAFNPTTEILAVASEKMKEAVRLVHLPSCTVFSNFPVMKKKSISHVRSMDFSPRGGYFALGNEKGKALMYSQQANRFALLDGDSVDGKCASVLVVLTPMKSSIHVPKGYQAADVSIRDFQLRPENKPHFGISVTLDFRAHKLTVQLVFSEHAQITVEMKAMA
ncbi:U3 small nucleolar RNA-associated protein 18 like protein [Fukomys damarensis]|uniref:U3 small nucleolar RNA-associated protein 18 homolog n=1 Tax=Fukomys damarensis TaxID=885580 RepID=A0A091DXD7_FUKDA|nr:U3 small nucleolar RNA-associated protein 18 like protein [Fukomys damarensis]